MDLFSSASIIVVLAAIFGFINARFLRLPNAIGLMIVAIVSTLLFGASTWYKPDTVRLGATDGSEFGLRAHLARCHAGLFVVCRALHTNLGQLRIYRWPILIFATVSVLLSALITASLCYFAFRWLKLDVTVTQCLLFGGAHISHGPHCGHGDFEKSQCAKGIGDQDCRGVAIQ